MTKKYRKTRLIKNGSFVTSEGLLNGNTVIIKEAKTHKTKKRLLTETKFFDKNDHHDFIPKLIMGSYGIQITEKIPGKALGSEDARAIFTRIDAKKISNSLKDFKSIQYECNNKYFYELVRLLLKTFTINGLSRTIKIAFMNLRLFRKILRNSELTHGDFTERNIIFGHRLYIIDFTEIKMSVKYFDAAFMFLHNLRNLKIGSWHNDFLDDYLSRDDDLDMDLLRISFICAALWHLSNHPTSIERKKQLDYFLNSERIDELISL